MRLLRIFGLMLVGSFISLAGAEWSDQFGSPTPLPGLDGPLNAMIIYEGDLVVAGRFQLAGGVAVNGIARFDGQTWHALGDGLARDPSRRDTRDCTDEPVVHAMCLFEGELIVAGRFCRAGGVPVGNLAAWDGTSWHALGEHDAARAVSALAVYDGKLYLGYESSSTPCSVLTSWDGASWQRHSTSDPPGFRTPRHRVTALAPHAGRLILAGNFSDSTGMEHHLLAFDGVRCSVLDIKALRLKRGSRINALASDNDRLLIGGRLLTEQHEELVLLYYDGETWTNAFKGSRGEVKSILPCGDHLYVGRRHHKDRETAAQVEISYLPPHDRRLMGGAHAIWHWDGSAWQILPPRLYGAPRALVFHRGALYVGGSSRALVQPTLQGNGADTIHVGHIVQIVNDRAWPVGMAPPAGLGLDQRIATFAKYEGELIAAGGFSLAGAVGAEKIARWDGKHWAPLGPGLPARLVFHRSPRSVNALTIYGGELIAAGDFNNPATDEPPGLARWNGATWAPLPSPSPTDCQPTRVLTVFRGDLIADGIRDAAVHQQIYQLARWDGAAWHPLGDGFDEPIGALTVFNGELIAGGSFRSIGDLPVPGIAAWNGERWHPLGTGLGSSITTFEVYSLGVHAGQLLAGGQFRDRDQGRMHLLARFDGVDWRLIRDGPRDLEGHSRIRAFASHGDWLYVAGHFVLPGEEPTYHIARWNGAGWEPVGHGLGPLDSEIYALKEYRGGLFVGGFFQRAGQAAAANIAQWFPD